MGFVSDARTLECRMWCENACTMACTLSACRSGEAPRAYCLQLIFNSLRERNIHSSFMHPTAH